VSDIAPPAVDGGSAAPAAPVASAAPAATAPSAAAAPPAFDWDAWDGTAEVPEVYRPAVTRARTLAESPWKAKESAWSADKAAWEKERGEVGAKLTTAERERARLDLLVQSFEGGEDPAPLSEAQRALTELRAQHDTLTTAHQKVRDEMAAYEAHEAERAAEHIAATYPDVWKDAAARATAAELMDAGLELGEAIEVARKRHNLTAAAPKPAPSPAADLVGGADGAASRSLPLGDAIPAGLSSRDMIKHVIGETFRQRAH